MPRRRYTDTELEVEVRAFEEYKRAYQAGELDFHASTRQAKTGKEICCEFVNYQRRQWGLPLLTGVELEAAALTFWEQSPSGELWHVYDALALLRQYYASGPA